MPIATDTAALLRAAQGYCADSEGRFDITMGAVVRLWNFHEGTVPERERIREALAHVDWRTLRVWDEPTAAAAESAAPQTGTTAGRQAFAQLEDPLAAVDVGGIAKGWIADAVADLLAEEHVPVVSGPYMTDRSKPEIRNLSDAAPGLLCKAGIETAITVNHPEIPLRLLPMALMLAVRAGMDKTDALRAVTSVPAKIAGMQDRIGSLKTGLDADCVLWSGDPLDIATQVQAVFVNGTPEYRRTK